MKRSDSSMNILLINYEFPPIGAGASIATWHIGKELAAMGHQITVLTSAYQKNRGYDVKDGMRIYRCPTIRRKPGESNIIEMLCFLFSAVLFMPWILVKHRIKVSIIFFSSPCGPLGLLGRIFFRIPYVISLRGGDVPGNEIRLNPLHYWLTPLRRIVLKKSMAVIANSQGLKKLSEAADPCPVKVIPNGVDTYRYTPGLVKKSNSSFVFLFAGRICRQKNLFFLIEQFSLFLKETKKEALLYMVGEGPLIDALKKFAVHKGVSGKIVWPGWLEKKELLSLYRKSHCFINPSFNEGMPNAVLEAMACGLTIIASRVTGHNDIISDKENGLLFNIDDHAEIQNAFHTVTENEKRCLELGTNARLTAACKFSWRKTASDYFKVLNSRGF